MGITISQCNLRLFKDMSIFPPYHLQFSVLLRAVLGDHPLAAREGVPQAAGQGGGGQAEDGAVQVVLSNSIGTGGKEQQRKMKKKEK